MSGCRPLKARSSVRAEIPSRAASALRPPTHCEKSARADGAANIRAEAARQHKTARFMGPIIRDSGIVVEAVRLAPKTSAATGTRTMRWPIALGSVAGTAVKIHIAFLLFLAWIAFRGWARRWRFAPRGPAGGSPARREAREKGAGSRPAPIATRRWGLSRQRATAGLAGTLGFRRDAAAPARPAKPSSIKAQVDGWGTADGMAPGLNRSASEFAPPAAPR